MSGSHNQSAKSRKEVAQKPAGLDAGGLVSAGAGKGVWISLVQHQGLRVCRSAITGINPSISQSFNDSQVDRLQLHSKFLHRDM